MSPILTCPEIFVSKPSQFYPAMYDLSPIYSKPYLLTTFSEHTCVCFHRQVHFQETCYAHDRELLQDGLRCLVLGDSWLGYGCFANTIDPYLSRSIAARHDGNVHPAYLTQCRRARKPASCGESLPDVHLKATVVARVLAWSTVR
jgi:hypothetical protein